MKNAARLLCWLSVSVSIAFAQSPEPRFASEALASLTCAVVQHEPSAFGVRLLVEVRNASTTLAAEPLAFELTRTDKKARKNEENVSRVEIARVSLPFVRRFGRAAPAKGRERYWLQAGFAAEEARFEARVTRASWFEGAPAPRPSIDVGKPQRADFTANDGRALGATAVALSNPHSLDIDLVFLATFAAPRDTEALLGVRIRAASEREWIISQLPGQLTFSEEPGYAPVRVEKLALVDWSWVAPDDPADDERRFQEFYRHWVRWPTPYPRLAGRFRFSDIGADHDLRGNGAFRMDADGGVQLELEEPKDENRARSVQRTALEAFAALFAQMKRPSADEVLEKNTLRRVGEDTFRIDGPGWWVLHPGAWSGSTTASNGESAPNFTLRDGLLASSGSGANFEGYTWSSRWGARGWLVAQRRNAADQWIETFEHTQLGELVVPTAYRQRMGVRGVGPCKYVTLELSDVRLEGSTPPEPVRVRPTGAGVEVLRAAWENGHRYSVQPRELSARFDVRTPGTDRCWEGQEALRGAVRLKDYRGFRCDEAGWSGYEIEVDGEFSEGERGLLAWVVEDRLRLWAARDFNGRGEFDALFAGATVEAPLEDGTLNVLGGPCRSVVVRDGRVVAKTANWGATTHFTWSKVGDRWLVTRTQCGAEEVSAKFARLGADFVPTTLDFQRLFGERWGPESVALTSIEIR
jgi:hypothetical protein